MITRALHLNLSRDDRDVKRNVWATVDAVPTGSRVVLYVGQRAVDFETAQWLGQFVDTLHFDVQGSTTAAIDSWADAIASSSWLRGRP